MRIGVSPPPPATVRATGAAGGPTNPHPPNAAAISPSAQLGYYQRLSDSRWLLGGKLTYNYIAATATDNFVGGMVDRQCAISTGNEYASDSTRGVEPQGKEKGRSQEAASVYLKSLASSLLSRSTLPPLTSLLVR